MQEVNLFSKTYYVKGVTFKNKDTAHHPVQGDYMEAWGEFDNLDVTHPIIRNALQPQTITDIPLQEYNSQSKNFHQNSLHEYLINVTKVHNIITPISRVYGEASNRITTTSTQPC